jgi:tRNA G18 (ribose-2'-O)-methylase SpoU
LLEKCKNVSEEVESDIKEFVNDLVDRGFAGYETTVRERRFEMDDKELTYEKPTLLILGASDSGVSDNAEPEDSAMCDVGQAAAYLCGLGFSPALLCGEGAGDEG